MTSSCDRFFRFISPVPWAPLQQVGPPSRLPNIHINDGKLIVMLLSIPDPFTVIYLHFLIFLIILKDYKVLENPTQLSMW